MATPTFFMFIILKLSELIILLSKPMDRALKSCTNILQTAPLIIYVFGITAKPNETEQNKLRCHEHDIPAIRYYPAILPYGLCILIESTDGRYTCEPAIQ